MTLLKVEPPLTPRSRMHVVEGRTLLREHWLFATVLLAAALLRVLVILAVRPAEIYWSDSYEYLQFGVHPKPAMDLHPGGYGSFLWLLHPFHSLRLIVVLQHLMGLTSGLMIYMVLRRRSVPTWGAVLATLPTLFDIELVHLEHAVLSDTLFTFLIVSAVTVVLWSPTISTRVASSAGLLRQRYARETYEWSQ